MNAFNDNSMITIGIVGCDRGATSVIDLLRHDPGVDISFVHDSDPAAPGLRVAKTNNIPILNSLDEVGSRPVDILLNLTGSIDTGLKIKKLVGPEVELIGSRSAKLIYSIMDERRIRFEEHERVTAEREVFRRMGLHMEKIDNMKDAGFAIIDYAMTLGDMPAGALSYYDEEANEMVLVASNGLAGFEQNMRWPVGECAASHKIITTNSSDPEAFDSFELEQMPGTLISTLGIKSIIAIPLLLKEKIHSIIYLYDFTERVFIKGDLSILSLLGVYASLIMDKVKIYEKMRHLVVTDGLTGLTNQRSFMEHFEKEFQRSSRYTHDLSIVIFDIDNFKHYTDEYGHLQGNELLKHLSDLLVKSVRTTDVAARFGVEKFCILLCEIGKEGAFTFAQRLVERIACYPMPNEGITVSAGVATYPRDAKGYMELISRAEGNLHKAKEWGRNRACS